MASGAAVSAVLLLCAEFGLRAAGLGPSPERFRWLAHAQLQSVPAPNQNTWYCKDSATTGERRLPLRINSLGLRGEDFPLAKPAGERRILVVGDSLTFGQGVRDEESWPAQLGGLLGADSTSGLRWRAINAGVNGWSAWHYQRYVETQALQLDPDLVVVGLYFGNDMLPPPDLAGPPAWLENTLRRTALYDAVVRLYRRQLSSPVAPRARQSASDSAQARIERYVGVRESELRPREQRELWSLVALPALESMRDVCERNGIPFLCVLIPTPLLGCKQTSVEAYELLKAAIERSRIAVIDPLPALYELGEKAWLPWDPGHLSVEGNRCLAQVVRPAVSAAASALSEH